MTEDPEENARLQNALTDLANRLGVAAPQVGARSNGHDDVLSIFVDTDGRHHFGYWERGKLVFDHTGTLDDALYWYCEGVVSQRAPGDRRERFRFGYDVLSSYNPDWGRRYVRELASSFRRNHPDQSRPRDLSLLPDIGEDL
ncbi:hypothetical protein E3G68_005293 [Mycobacteroides abscessus]|uniref:hypothetical protein n=1 Tax=Mycobacteroides abscessus TaxID=36809 RepID=UPI001C6CE1C4|nr:hypothetical protein [Mycobacteroides abscessus]